MIRATQKFKTKVCLVGESGVGKTSLIRRFVLDEFDDKYIATTGAKVSKIGLEMPFGDATYDVTMAIFDIIGQEGFRDLIKESHFEGAQGALAVADVTRQETLFELSTWIDTVLDIAGRVPMILLLNKTDLSSHITEDHLENFNATYQLPVVRTSAKTGTMVEDAFYALGVGMLEHVRKQTSAEAKVAALGMQILALMAKRRVHEVTKLDLFEHIRGVSYDDLEREVATLEEQGLVTLEWTGPANFAARLTEKGLKAAAAA